MNASFLKELTLIKKASLDYTFSKNFGQRPSPIRVAPAPNPAFGKSPVTNLTKSRNLQGYAQGTMPLSEYKAELQRRYPDLPFAMDELATIKNMKIDENPNILFRQQPTDAGGYFKPSSGTILSQSASPLTLPHELGHLQDYQDRFAYGTADSTLSYERRGERAALLERKMIENRARQRAVEKFPLPKGLEYFENPSLYQGGTFSFDPLKRNYYEKLQSLSPEMRDTLFDTLNARNQEYFDQKYLQRTNETLRQERIATRKALDSYEPYQKYLRGEKITPRQREAIADLLSAQTTYYTLPNALPANALIERQEAINRMIDPKLNRLKGIKFNTSTPKFKAQPSDTKNKVFMAGIRGKRLQRKIEAQSPFNTANMWKRMPLETKKQYILHIKANKNRLTKDFGEKAGKLYMSEMMKALRKMLRR